MRELLERWACAGLCLLLAAASTPAIFGAPLPAAKDVTVDQLEQLLKQMRGQGDVKVARQITNIKLTERVSLARLAQWEAELAGERSRQALMAVADASAFLAPPAADTPKLPPPDADTLQQILTRCMDYVKQRLPRLPDYFALRTTTAFAITTADRLESMQDANELFQKKHAPKLNYNALGPAKSSDSPEQQYFWLGSYAQEVTYHGQDEVVNTAPGANGRQHESPYVLTTSGEFGSVLSVILVDVSQDQMVWDHWEQGSRGPLAVFHYSVPAERSHFWLHYANERSEHPAYHGEVAIDPESGAIWRITLLTGGSESGFFAESSLVVDFAPTEIAEARYICPVHSVAMIRYFDTFEYANTAHTPVPFQISLNDVMFTNYHQFRSESHILSGASAP